MPRASSAGHSNARLPEGQQRTYYGTTSRPIEKMEETPSAGTSYSTSERTPARSGSSTTTDLQSPVPDAESLSSPDQPVEPVSTSANSTAGSTHATGSDPASPPDSSAESVPAPEASADLRSDPSWEATGPSEEDPSAGGFLVQ